MERKFFDEGILNEFLKEEGFKEEENENKIEDVDVSILSRL